MRQYYAMAYKKNNKKQYISSQLMISRKNNSFFQQKNHFQDRGTSQQPFEEIYSQPRTKPYKRGGSVLKSAPKSKNNEVSLERLRRELKDTSWLFEQSKQKLKQVKKGKVHSNKQIIQEKKIEVEQVNIEDLHYQMVETHQKVRKLQNQCLKQ